MCQVRVRTGFSSQSGESLVECVFVCALIAIVVISILAHTGQQSKARLADVSGAFDESKIAGASKPAKSTAK